MTPEGVSELTKMGTKNEGSHVGWRSNLFQEPRQQPGGEPPPYSLDRSRQPPADEDASAPAQATSRQEEVRAMRDWLAFPKAAFPGAYPVLKPGDPAVSYGESYERQDMTLGKMIRRHRVPARKWPLGLHGRAVRAKVLLEGLIRHWSEALEDDCRSVAQMVIWTGWYAFGREEFEDMWDEFFEQER
jgi:hypothetical protein